MGGAHHNINARSLDPAKSGYICEMLTSQDTLMLQIHWNECHEDFWMDLFCPVNIPEEHRPAIYKLLNTVQNNSIHGKFNIDKRGFLHIASSVSLDPFIRNLQRLTEEVKSANHFSDETRSTLLNAIEKNCAPDAEVFEMLEDNLYFMYKDVKSPIFDLLYHHASAGAADSESISSDKDTLNALMQLLANHKADDSSSDNEDGSYHEDADNTDDMPAAE